MAVFLFNKSSFQHYNFFRLPIIFSLEIPFPAEQFIIISPSIFSLYPTPHFLYFFLFPVTTLLFTLSQLVFDFF